MPPTPLHHGHEPWALCPPRVCILDHESPHSLLYTLLMNSLSICADHEIPHFFCDINLLLSLSCTDPFINELVIFTIRDLTGLVCMLCLIISCIHFLDHPEDPLSSGDAEFLFSQQLTSLCVVYSLGLPFVFISVPPQPAQHKRVQLFQ